MALVDRLSALRGFSAQFFHARPGLTLGALALVPLASYAVSSYRGFLALGRGGIPYNAFGWLLQCLMQPIARRDLTNLAPYTDPEVVERFAPLGRQSFLPGPLAERGGPRPDVPNYVVPQRQMTERAPPEMIAKMRAYLDTLAGTNVAWFVARPSKLEGVGTPAIHVHEGQGPAFMAKTMLGTEALHVHDEGSSHMTLSLKDAEEVIAKGWGQRHMLSGRGNMLPWNYVLVYTPRDDGEYAAWQGLVQATMAYIAGGAKIEL
ncbi:hypothetical protein GQ53DRAFT_758534 [Thozetella sp. PMI_491]|nr:hypothetical protein GQ53DRAFT_758534 [Thozetella sp. PMI_491]